MDRQTGMEMYYEELAYAMMEAEKFHSLLSASQTPRQGSGVILVQGQETEAAHTVGFGERRCVTWGGLSRHHKGDLARAVLKGPH